MSFGLCNALGTFQRYMNIFFVDFIKNLIEVIMNDFTMYGSSFDVCMNSLDKFLKRCIELTLV